MGVFRRFLRGVSVLGISRPGARRFAIIRGELRARGELVSQPDMLIAAIVIEHGLTLLTRNARDFVRIPSLKLHQAG